MTRVLILFLVAIFGFSAQANAATKDIQACMEVSAKKYDIHPYLIWAIAKTESDFNPLAVGKNSNGTRDIGLMQINDTWLKKLSNYGITRAKLYDPCVSIEVGSWIIAHNFKTYGHNWRAIGAYNAKTEWKRVRYARKIEANLKLAYKLAGNRQEYVASIDRVGGDVEVKQKLRVIE